MSATIPFATLAIPFYNEAQCIEAAQEPAEILVADVGSPDRTQEIVKRVGGEDIRVRVPPRSPMRESSNLAAW